MKTEEEKMYENAEVKKYKKGYCDWDSNCPYPYHKCNDECPYYKYEDNEQYPPFTAEKQLELIKWLIKNHKYFVFVVDVSNFEETLAKFINELAKDNWLTEAEQNEIKNILKG